MSYDSYLIGETYKYLDSTEDAICPCIECGIDCDHSEDRTCESCRVAEYEAS